MFKIITNKTSSGKLPFLVLVLLVSAIIVLCMSCITQESKEPEVQTKLIHVPPHTVGECYRKNGTIETVIVRTENPLSENWIPGWVWNDDLKMQVYQYVRAK